MGTKPLKYKYQNHHGESGVVAFDIGAEFIEVQFRNNDYVYLYNYDQPGEEQVENMKRLALLGKGLSTYISQEIGQNYAARF